MFESFRPKLLRPAFEAYSTPEERNKLARKCRAKVVEWRWATGDMAFALRRPFVKELHRCDPRWLKEGVKPKPGNVRHGLDAGGAIHVVIKPSRGVSEMHEKQGVSTYLVYAKGQTEAITYRYTPGKLEHLRRCVYDGGRLVREHMLVRSNGSESYYLWDDGKLDRVLSMGWGQSFNSDARSWGQVRVEAHTETRFEYDWLGRLERIVERYLNKDGTIDKDLGPRIEYERPKKDESIPKLAGDIERMLFEQVPAAVAKANGKGPFYCLLLCYCGEDFQAGWPPFLLLGSEAHRQRIIQEGKEPYNLWSVPSVEEHEGNVRINLKGDVSNYCRLHAQLMDVKDDYSSAMKTLRRVSKSLNTIDWSKIMEVTPDFLVAAVDDHGEVDPAEDIKAVIPAAKFRSLRKQGLI